MRQNSRIAKTVGISVFIVGFVVFLGGPADATVFGNIRGIVHDPQHHPVNAAHATLQANDSAFKMTAETGDDGEFHFDAVPLGTYTVNVDAPGFAMQSQLLAEVSRD
jgi:hypothetical protein